MSWTEERIDQLKKLWESGMTASQIAEELGGVSRNAVIGKAHRLGLQSRPSPVKGSGDSAAKAKRAAAASAAPAAAPVEAAPPPPAAEPAPPPPAPVARKPVEAAPKAAPAPARPRPAPAAAPEPTPAAADAAEPETPNAPPQPMVRSIGPGGFARAMPGDQGPAAPAPPRRLVPARPSADIAGKTSLLDLTDRICKWPIGHPGEPDFHFCGQPINPGFPYCLNHCSVAYQAQLPRRDRRPPPSLPFGGPRGR